MDNKCLQGGRGDLKPKEGRGRPCRFPEQGSESQRIEIRFLASTNQLCDPE